MTALATQVLALRRLCRKTQADARAGREQRRRRKERTEGHSVAWRTALRAADATATRRDRCERCDAQQCGPNARGRAAREERLAMCFGGMCGCEVRLCALTSAYRGR